jgi:hypothetical protein
MEPSGLGSGYPYCVDIALALFWQHAAEHRGNSQRTKLDRERLE